MHSQIHSSSSAEQRAETYRAVFPCPNSATTLAPGHDSTLTLANSSTELLRSSVTKALPKWEERKSFCLTKLRTNTTIKSQFHSQT